MDLEIKWHQPISLNDGEKENLIYILPDMSNWDEVPGVYIFGRLYGGTLTPLYIGRTKDIKKRMKQHLNTTKLMKGIENSSSGEKVLIVGEFVSKSGQSTESSLRIIERALIEHALAEGYELLNKTGTKTPTHNIQYTGYQAAKVFSGSCMFTKMKR
jgi:predicted GIY-YIG superfamily endonuclease